MFLKLLSLFFCWLIYRRLFCSRQKADWVSITYVLALASLAVASALPAYRIWRLENFLTEKATILTERPEAFVTCKTTLESIRDGGMLNWGTAYIETGEIVLEDNWCNIFLEYLGDPENSSPLALHAMHTFTHELMHIRGEWDESKAECQAIQRNHIVGETLGIAPTVAHENARRLYKIYYHNSIYFSKHCKPEGKYDEKLPNSIWSKKKAYDLSTILGPKH